MVKEMKTPWRYLLEEYQNYLENTPDFSSVKFYIDKMRTSISLLNIGKTEEEKHFFDLLPKMLYVDQYRDKVNKKHIEELIKTLKKRKGNNKNDSSYVNKFLNFLEDTVLKEENDFITKFKTRKDFKNILKFTAADDATLANETGELYYSDRLRCIFSSRLRSQDRTSGEKIWLPLDFISSIFYARKSPFFTNWISELVDNVIVHYLDNYKICSRKFKESYTLKFKENNGEFDVYVMFPDIPKKEFRVFTPTGNGNEKLPMTVGSISDITIDHVVPIDQTLKRLGDENQLTQLELITNLYKNLSITQDEIEKNPYINCSDVNEIKKQKKNDKKEAKKKAIERYKQSLKKSLKKLETELNLIKNDSPLRLMDSRYNSQKSNGKTYNKILHSNNNYYGIMIENEIIDDGNNTVTLYQILTDDVIDQSRQNGQLRVTKDPLEGESVRGREPLEEIINRI